MGAGNEFEVMVSKEEVVTAAAAVPLQEHWLPLSNLDLLLPPLDVGVFFCYKSPDPSSTGETTAFVSVVDALKRALAQALLSYDVFSGEVVLNSLGQPEILCNNRGVHFSEAFADVNLRDLNLYNPDESVEGKLVPRKKQGVLAVQVTELKCGGFVVGCSFDHRVADAYSANMFFVSWAQMAQFKPPLFQPYLQRSLLNPSHPGRVDSSLDNIFVPISDLPPEDPKAEPDTDHLVSRVYYITAEQLSLLQARACSNGEKRTKLECFSSFLWKMVAKHALKKHQKNVVTKMGIVVDGRARLSQGDEKKEGLMAKYFGNVLSVPFGEIGVSEVSEKPLSWVAEEVHKFLSVAVTKEHFLGLINWVEARRPVASVTRVYCRKTGDGPNLVVSSGQRFPISKIDFGWGKPVFGSYHFPWGGSAGYVMPMPSPVGHGDWIVYMHMMEGDLNFIEDEAASVFKPLTNDYLQIV